MSLRYRVSGFIKRFERQYDAYNHIDVSASALRHNLHLFQESSGLAVFPVLKGNAYGHGLEQVVTALRPEKLPYIAVDGYFEALRIRDISRQPLLVMGAIKPENFKRLRYDGFTFVVQHEATVRALGRTGKHIKVHLEVNTGMNRYGVQPETVTGMTKLILGYKNLELEGVMTHLADSDGDDPRTVEAAVRLFDEAVETVRACGADPRWLHAAQTAGSVVAKSRYANAMRLGIGLYGVNPFDAARAGRLPGLKPALRLVSAIAQIIDLKQGDQVSYNYTFTAPKDMRIAVLPLGYYEGVSRPLSNIGFVKIGKVFCPIVGRVCMNHTMIDISGVDCAIGDDVVVYSDVAGDRNSIGVIAEANGLFNYNLLTALSSDVRRRLVR